jgi:hypothetical protein
MVMVLLPYVAAAASGLKAFSAVPVEQAARDKAEAAATAAVNTFFVVFIFIPPIQVWCPGDNLMCAPTAAHGKDYTPIRFFHQHIYRLRM